VDASAAGNCAYNSDNHKEHVMNAAVGAVVVTQGAAVVTPGAAVGFVCLDREVMWSGGMKIADAAAAATSGDLPAAVGSAAVATAAVATTCAALHLAKNHGA